MFFFNKNKEVNHIVTMRDEWGVLQEVEVKRDTLRLTDQELADSMGTSLTTVETHRRD